MPYGSDYRTAPVSVAQNKVNWNTGVITDGPTLSWTTFQEHASTRWSRSGTNYVHPMSSAPTCRNTGKGSGQYPMQWELVALPLGPRLPYKVFSKRLQKFVWARKPTLVYRLRPIKPPRRRKRPVKSLDIPPNALNFTSVGVSYNGPRSIVAYSSPYKESYGYSGDLWLPFAPYGGGSFSGINVQDYLGTNISSISNSLVTLATEAANSKSYSRVKNMSVNLLQMIAERRQVIDMFVQGATRVAKTLLLLKAFKLKQAILTLFPHNPQQLANDWLVLQYGLKPLLSDIDGLAKELAVGETIVRDVVAKCKKKSELQLVSTRTENNTPLSYRDEVWIQSEVEVKFKYRLRAVSTAREVTRLGLDNLNSVAWEVIPFSFIADWFIPIGEYLNTQDAFGNVEIVHATKTVFINETILFKRVFGGNFYSYITPDGQCSVVIKKVSCVRELISSPPPLTFPSFKNPVSTGHILNAIALFTQLRR